MKIVKASAVIEDATPNAIERIEAVGRTCYKSEEAIGPGTAEKFVRMIRDKGHLAMLDHASASVRFVVDRGCCYSADTDVLTDEGWKPWPEVRGDERFATLTPDHRVEWHEATKVIREPYVGEMYELRSGMIDLCVTPEHNLYVQKHDTQAAKRKEEPWQLVPAKEIAGKRVSHKRDALSREKGVSSFVVADFVTEQGNCRGEIQPHTRKGRTYDARTFAKFLGYWLSEGSLDHTPGSSYQILLFQNVGPVLDEMLSILKEMGYNPSVASNGGSLTNKAVSICDVALYTYLKQWSGALNKRIPREVLNTFSGEDLRSLLLRYVYGDGSIHHDGGHMQMYTVSSGMADDLQEAALHAGISATVWVDDRIGKAGGIQGIVHRHPCYVVSLVTAKNTPLVNHGTKMRKGKPHERWTAYDGVVYCVTVPNHTLYVRRHGRPCWSGNSHEIVRHRIGVGYAQESTRYCNYSKGKFGGECTFIKPCFWSEDSDCFVSWKLAMESAEASYLNLLAAGAKPQEARSVLPNSLKTEIVVTGTFTYWRHFFKLRTDKAAHPQMREVAVPLLYSFANNWHAAFGDIELDYEPG